MTHNKSQEDLVVVRTYSYRHEAEIGRTMLESNGIDAMIVADDAGGMRPSLGLMNGGVRLLVRRQDEQTTKKLLG